MNTDRQLNEAELDEIEAALTAGRLRDEPRLDGWVRRLLAEARSARSRPALETEEPRKPHGDALLDAEGSRHGPEPRRD